MIHIIYAENFIENDKEKAICTYQIQPNHMLITLDSTLKKSSTLIMIHLNRNITCVDMYWITISNFRNHRWKEYKFITRHSQCNIFGWRWRKFKRTWIKLTVELTCLTRVYVPKTPVQNLHFWFVVF